MQPNHVPFQRYDEEFKSLTKQLQDSIQDDDEEQGRHAAGLISQCDEILQQMALEARSVQDATLKRQLLAQVRNYKSELSSLKDEYNKKSLMQLFISSTELDIVLSKRTLLNLIK